MPGSPAVRLATRTGSTAGTVSSRSTRPASSSAPSGRADGQDRRRLDRQRQLDHGLGSFAEAIARGGVHADAKMADRLYFRGLGYKHKAVKIFKNKDEAPTIVPYVEHYPPDTNAALAWLARRQPDKWK